MKGTQPLRKLCLLAALLPLALSCRDGSTVPASGKFFGRLESPPSVRLGETATFTFVATNSTSDPADLDLRMTANVAFVVTVRNEAGSTVWSKAPAELIMEPGQVVAVGPNAEARITTTWDLRDTNQQFVSAGRYFVSASLLLERGTVLEAQNAPVEIVIRAN